MTCEEAKRMMDIMPQDVTTAERSALVRHLDSCQACRKFLEEESEQWYRENTPHPLERLAVEIDMEELARELHAKDVQDPEAR